VMAGAIAVGFGPFQWAGRRRRTLLGGPMQLPAKTPISTRLAGGSVMFGIGWGLVGLCPGPALVALGMGLRPALVFVAAMLAGMLVYEGIERLQRRTRLQEV
jgi:uncharacterized membrane protein YedE/YeeE